MLDVVFGKALVILLLAYGVTFAVLYLSFKQRFYVNAFLVSVFITAVVFLTGSPVLVFCVVMGISIFLPLKGEDRMSSYLVLLPLLPLTWGFTVPGFLPGMNYIIELKHPLYLALLILLPLMVNYIYKQGTFLLQSKYGKGWMLDVFVLSYFLLLMALNFRAPTVTSGLREVVMFFLMAILPYLVFSRYVNKPEHFFLVARALFFAVFLSVGVGILSELLTWNFYTVLKPFMLHGVYTGGLLEFRGAFLRVNYTMVSPIAYGYFLVTGVFALSMMACWYPKRQGIFLMFALLICIPLVFTVSRGAWLALLVFVLLYFYLQRHLKFKIIAVVIMLIVIGPLTMGAPGHDEYGTFDYRARLIDISQQVFLVHPLFGDTDFSSSALFDELRRVDSGMGEGFIDIVNTYIFIALKYGGVALFMFVSILISAFVLVLHSFGRLGDHQDVGKLKRTGKCLGAFVMATLVLLATVSSIAYITIYFWILIALVVAYLNVVEATLKDGCISSGSNEHESVDG